MLKRGDVDVATLLTDIYYEEVKRDPKFKLLLPGSPTRWFVYMAAQWDSNSPWSDQRIRKAAGLAIDRKTLADIHMPGCGPIGSFRVGSDSTASDIPADPYNPEKAKKLLSEAGYPKGFHGGRFYPYNGTMWKYGEQIANYWKAVGINVDTVLLERPAWLASRSSGKMKGGLFIDIVAALTLGGTMSYLFGPTAYGKYPGVQTLWNQYTKTIDQEKRNELMNKLQWSIYEKTMFLPLTNQNSPTACNMRVKGNPCRNQPFIWFISPLEDVELAR